MHVQILVYLPLSLELSLKTTDPPPSEHECRRELESLRRQLRQSGSGDQELMLQLRDDARRWVCVSS